MESKKRQVVGRVTSNKMDKTIIVEVKDMITHPVYKKYIRTKKKIKSHDEKNECQINDLVRVEETRPLSREKRYRLVEIIEKAK